MAHEKGRANSCPLVALIGLLTLVNPSPASELASAPTSIAQTQPTPEKTFTARNASRLLDQIAAGLVDHNRRKILSAFDLDRMSDGALFEQQITSFLAHSGNIRVHYNAIETGVEEGRAVASVDFEMDADQRDDNLPPVRKRARLRLVAESTSAGWKLIDVQPRSFFSLNQP